MQFQFAASRAAAVSTSREVFAPSAERLTRTSTTVTLVAVALCGLLADRHILADASAPPVPAAAQNRVAKVIAPEFCKDQTWPYLDGRCLRRIENPTPAAPPPVRQDAPPSNTAAATPAPQLSINNATTAPADNQPAGSAPQQAAAAAPQRNAGKQVIDLVFPRAEPGAAGQNENAAPPNDASAAVTPSDAPAYQRASDAARSRSRHWGGDYNRSFDARF